MFDGVIPAIMRQAMGQEISDMLEIPYSKWERVIGRKSFRLLNILDRLSGPIGGLVERLAISFMNGKSRRILNNEPATFSMSDELRSNFQRLAMQAIDAYESIWEDGELSEEEKEFMQELQEQLSLSDADMKKFATLGAINAAISDEKIDPEEIELIDELAKEAGLSKDDLSLIHIALEDGKINSDEREMLNQLLGVVSQ